MLKISDHPLTLKITNEQELDSAIAKLDWVWDSHDGPAVEVRRALIDAIEQYEAIHYDFGEWELPKK
jgi:hypothetical protein